jgi:molybdenum cofactor biosynthesis protein B
MSYSQHRTSSANRIVRCAVVTLSDTRTTETDTSGKKIIELLKTAGHLLADYRILKDEPFELTAALNALLGQADVDAILTTGGTGISRRDQTVEVIEKILEQPLPGFGELFRFLSYQQIASGAMLSRAVGGIARGKLIFAMPGSTGAVELAMTKLILPEVRHLAHILSEGVPAAVEGSGRNVVEP